MISAEQYLRSSFEHDAEFVEGKLVERPAPAWEHADMQGFLIQELWPICRGIGYFGVPEQRVPPWLCVEILSPEDSMVETLEKVREYLHFGVAWVWVIDPVSLTGQVHSLDSIVSVEDRIFSTDRFSIDLAKAQF